MNTSLSCETLPLMTLQAATALDLMTADPVSIQQDATVREAVVFLTDKGFSAAPVIDAAGRTVGVLSRSDVLTHDRETADYLDRVPEYYDRSDLTLDSGEHLGWGIQVEKADYCRVRDIMTPVVFAVTPDTPVSEVVHKLVDLKVHRLFVVDDNGTLIGVISTLDVLRRLSF